METRFSDSNLSAKIPTKDVFKRQFDRFDRQAMGVRGFDVSNYTIDNGAFITSEAVALHLIGTTYTFKLYILLQFTV